MLYQLKTCLCLILITSAYITKAQEQEKNIPPRLQISRQINQPVEANDEIRFSTLENFQRATLCSCYVQTSINPGNRNGSTWTYSGTPNASCFGQIQTTPGQFADTCGVISLTYAWSIVAGNAVA